MPRTSTTDPSLVTRFLDCSPSRSGSIEQGQLVAAFQAWTRDKSRPIADHLASHGHLDRDQLAALDAPSLCS